ncbi:MAG: alpha/beta hydrolase, partial [Dehalococcoidia bacterium]|nr:alpha/beta hydrolase [Dehalococcoidia bacterium]
MHGILSWVSKEARDAIVSLVRQRLQPDGLFYVSYNCMPGWAPIERRALPFPSVLVASRDDPYCRFERAQALAQAWGSRFIDAGARGHLNAESGLGDWPQALDW